ncbi:MAG: SDR family oxidoreductase [Actinomycetota bacterium]|jgi:NAD(P)-dependent dehydrogenase (short-subunit alcohol dehydrogenase family)|nr:SDR family oxidoreductase [Actinomycetota bacterium]
MGVLCGHHAALGGGASSAAKVAVSARAQSLVEHDIRVNAVAPGLVWTPTIPAPMSQARVERSGEQVLMGRAAHPDEIAQS